MKKQVTPNNDSQTEKQPIQNNSPLFKLFKDGLSDLYWAENHLTKALPKMISAASSASLQKALSAHLAETKNQVSRLEEIFNLLDEKALAKKCDAMEGLSKEAEGIVEQTPSDSAVRDLGIILACGKVEHYEIASYTGLKNLADKLSLESVSELLQQTLDEEQAAEQKLNALGFEDIINQALSEA
ncbi:MULTISPECIES: ferritin-like domain-containing protein [unclassified Pedobacter]|uniref:ferritin-like domain-containing protein n=1 Tax=unclassified Pedobacter TaxID=2628915 RepID=UPI001E5268C9|nr:MULTISPECIES: ferritin-like domain-containing protein [unclassified Pedobacter]